jgi:hypothetical protein
MRHQEMPPNEIGGAIDSILAKCRYFKFCENLRHIRALKPTTASAASVRFASKAVKRPPGDDDGWIMFFLLRMAFWLGVVCVLLPGGRNNATEPQVDAASAVSAAGAAVSDMRGFCDRQPQACEVGGKVAVALGQKAEAGARTLYEIVSSRLNDKGSSAADVRKPIPVSAPGTLTPADLTPNWHSPVPLPPRREARASRPAV